VKLVGVDVVVNKGRTNWALSLSEFVNLTWDSFLC
jgi:hypothetical protein